MVSMIETIKDKDNKVVAYIEYNVLDKDDKIDDNGNYLCVRNLWIHESMRWKNVIEYFIKELNKNPLTKNVAWVYYRRSKTEKFKKIPAYKFLKRIKRS